MKRSGATIIAGLTIIAGGVAFGIATDAHASQRVTVEAPNEDEPGWNCYTHGNKSCGDNVTLVYTEGAILGAATDGRVYVSWEDGRVTHATKKQRKHAWRECVDAAWQADDPSDATLGECDESFEETGDRFHY